jgi:hypothetical protein
MIQGMGFEVSLVMLVKRFSKRRDNLEVQFDTAINKVLGIIAMEEPILDTNAGKQLS